MPRDADAKKITSKWAGGGQRSSPESQNITRSTGWDSDFAPPPTGSRFPLRRVFNQIWAEVTGFLAEINERGGILEWDAALDYVQHARVMGSDGEIYRAVTANGPSSTVVNPVGRANDSVWKRDIPDAPSNASATQRGIVELATNTEAIAGTDTARAITPAALKAAIPQLANSVPTASTTQSGTVELATNLEALQGTDTTRAVTPEGQRAHGDGRYIRSAIADWSNASGYVADALARGSDGHIYRAVVATSSSIGNVQNPVTRTDDTVWTLWALGSESGLPYAASGHTHSGFASASHSHTGFATSGHNHDSSYASASHTHSGYASSSHSHNYAASNHTHNYASSGHNHDSSYASASHTHNYAGASHTHSNYASSSHSHSSSDLPSGTLFTTYGLVTGISASHQPGSLDTTITLTRAGLSDISVTYRFDR